MRERRGKVKLSRGLGGWLAAVISLGCTVRALGSVLTLSLFTIVLDIGKKDGGAEASERAFYDLVGYVDNIETNMSKLFVASDSESRQRILGDLMVQSNLADSSLAALPIMDESKYYTSKYINQVGDYAKYLNNRLIDEQTLTNEDMDMLADKHWAVLQDTPIEFTIARENYNDELTSTVFDNPRLAALLKEHRIEVNAKDSIGVRV